MVELARQTCGDDLDERLGRAMPGTRNEVGADPFGVDLEAIRLSGAILVYLHRYWFRTESHGLENVPEGRALIVANHSGQVPLDGIIIALAMMLDADRPRFARSMIERYIGTLPFLSVWFPRVGQVMGSPENAQRLLESEEPLLIFPEGVRGISKTFDQRYRLRPFGQGFMRLALQTHTPIVPVAVIGAEEQYPSIGQLTFLRKMFGTPSMPLIPQLFVGMAAPLPVKYRLYFGEPMRFTGDPDDEDSVIDEKVWSVQATIQSMVNRGLRERRGIFW